MKSVQGLGWNLDSNLDWKHSEYTIMPNIQQDWEANKWKINITVDWMVFSLLPCGIDSSILMFITYTHMHESSIYSKTSHNSK